MKRISLFGRKRFSELTQEVDLSQAKRDELLALKLGQLESSAKENGELLLLPIAQVIPDPLQPRKTFKNIEALSSSIKANGIISPIIVSEIPQYQNPKRYRIIAGERRYRAAIQAGMTTLPCLCRSVDDENVLVLQILENDQRDNVSPLEEAEAIARLLEEKKMPKAEIAKALGRDAGWLSIRLGLLQASQAVKDLVRDGFIEDVRTLHELRMFEQEFKAEAEDLIFNIRHNRVSGANRQIIASARKALKSERKNPRRIKEEISRMSFENKELVIHTKQSKVHRFSASPHVIHTFLAALEEVQ